MRRATRGWVLIWLILQILLFGCRQRGDSVPVATDAPGALDATRQVEPTSISPTASAPTDGAESVSEKPPKPEPAVRVTAPITAEPLDEADASHDSWTLMFYMSSARALDEAALGVINQLEAVGSSAEVNIVVQLDRDEPAGQEDERWSGARRYVVEADEDRVTVASELERELGPVNMGDPDTLTDFLSWARDAYPANHYALIVWGDSRAWRGIATDAGEGDDLSLSDLGGAIERALAASEAEALDVVILDGHLTASVEILNTIQPFATFAVAKPQILRFGEIDYRGLVAALAEDGGLSPQQLAEQAATAGQAEPPAFVPIDLRVLPAVNDALELLAEYIVEHAGVVAPTLAGARDISQIAAANLPGSDERMAAVDLREFAKYLADFAPLPELARRGESLRHAVESAMLQAEIEGNGIHGAMALSFLPLGLVDDPAYGEVDAVGWQAALRAFYEADAELAIPAEGQVAMQGSDTTGAQQPALFGLELRTTNSDGAALATLIREEGENARLLDLQYLSPAPWLSGVYQQEITWDSTAPYLSDGANGDFAPLWHVPENELLMAAAQYLPAGADPAAADAILLFDPLNQSLESVWLTGDEQYGPQQVTPGSGDAFQLYHVYLGANQALEYSPGVTLVYSDGVEIGYDYFPLPGSTYQIGLLAEDVRGYNLVATQEVTVVNEALVPGYQVYLNSDYGFSFLYPLGWSDPVFDGRRVSTAPRQRGPALTISLYPQVGNSGAVQLKAETLEAFGDLDILYEETVPIGGGEGLLTAYGYNAADGPHTGVFISFVDRDQNLGYIADVDGLSLDENDTLEIARQLVESWRFVPVRAGKWSQQWLNTQLGPLTVALPGRYHHSKLDNGWELFREGATFLAVRQDAVSGEGMPAIAEHWAEVASRGVEEYVASAPQPYVVGATGWSRIDFGYLSEDGAVEGVIMATVIDGAEIVAWIETPADSLRALMNVDFLPSLAGLIVPAPRSSGVLFESTFDEVDSWGIGRQEGASGSVEEGFYRLDVDAPRGFFWTAAGAALAEAAYEVDVTQASGSPQTGFGLLFGVDEAAGSSYLFEISSDGYVWIGTCRNNCSDAATLVGDGWFASEAIRQGVGSTNRLRVAVSGPTWTFFINDQVVATVEGQTFSPGDVGLFAETFGEGGLTVQFDNVRVVTP